MKKTLITLLAVFFACAVSAMSAPDQTSQKPAPPEEEVEQESSDSIWDELWEETKQATIRLNEAMEVTAPFMDFESRTLDQKREALGNYAAFVRRTMQEELDRYSQEQIEAEAPDTTDYYFAKGSDIRWSKLSIPSEGLDTQPLIDEYIASFSQIGLLYLQCPDEDLWERMDMDEHRKALFSRFFDPEGTHILGCTLRSGECIDMQHLDPEQKWNYTEEHLHEIDSMRLQFVFSDPGKIRMIALDTLNNRATVGDRDFTLQSDGWDGVQLIIERHDREQDNTGERFIEAVNCLNEGLKSELPDMEIRFPELRKYTQGLTSAIDELDTCIADAETVSEEGIIPLSERIESCGSLHSDAQSTYSKQIRVYPETLGRIEIYYIGESQPRQVIVTKAIERQE